MSEYEYLELRYEFCIGMATYYDKKYKKDKRLYCFYMKAANNYKRLQSELTLEQAGY